jgi:hypothetical protein
MISARDGEARPRRVPSASLVGEENQGRLSFPPLVVPISSSIQARDVSGCTSAGTPRWHLTLSHHPGLSLLAPELFWRWLGKKLSSSQLPPGHRSCRAYATHTYRGCADKSYGPRLTPGYLLSFIPTTITLRHKGAESCAGTYSRSHRWARDHQRRCTQVPKCASLYPSISVPLSPTLCHTRTCTHIPTRTHTHTSPCFSWAIR